MKNFGFLSAIFGPDPGLPVGGLEPSRHPLVEAAMKNIISTFGELLLGLSFIALSRAIPMMVEPRLGAVVRLDPDTHWKFTFLAGCCLVLGFFQVLFLALNWSRVRTIVAMTGVFLSGALTLVFYRVDFHGVVSWTVILLIGNVIAVYLGETRERIRAT